MSRAIESMCLKTLAVCASTAETVCPNFQRITQGFVSRDVCIYKRTNNRLCENPFTIRVRYSKVAQQMGYEITFIAIKCYVSVQRVDMVCLSPQILDELDH